MDLRVHDPHAAGIVRDGEDTMRLRALPSLGLLVALACTPAAAPSPPPATAAPTAPPTTAPAVATLAPTAAPTATPAPLVRITASYSERVGNYLPLWLAFEQGIFRKHGLDVDLQLITGANGMSALLSGQVQIAQIGASEVVSAVASGSDLVASGNLSSVLPYVFIVSPDISSIDDLRGKQVGISSVGGSADIATRLSMQHFGLDPDKDITILAMGSLQNRTAGLQNGAIQAAPANPPDSVVLQRQGFKALFDIAALGFPAAAAVIVSQRGWVNEHRDLFQAWNDAVVESIALAKADPSLGVPVMKKYLQSDDDELIRPTYDYWITEIVKQPPSLSPDQFRDTVRALEKNNPKVRDVDLNKLIDPSFVQNAFSKLPAR
jgi:NitT/TauT family transport system substrate-binding protein